MAGREVEIHRGRLDKEILADRAQLLTQFLSKKIFKNFENFRKIFLFFSDGTFLGFLGFLENFRKFPLQKIKVFRNFQNFRFFFQIFQIFQNFSEFFRCNLQTFDSGHDRKNTFWKYFFIFEKKFSAFFRAPETSQHLVRTFPRIQMNPTLYGDSGRYPRSWVPGWSLQHSWVPGTLWGRPCSLLQKPHHCS